MKIADRLQTLGKQLEQQRLNIKDAEHILENKKAWVESAQKDLSAAQAAYVATHADLRKLADELSSDSIPKQPSEKILESLIEEVLDLSPRSSNCLKAGKITTVRELLSSIYYLKPSQIPNLGRKSIKNIKTALAEKGLWTES
jgi:DNA-directed RNA polymerase alpha subunit